MSASDERAKAIQLAPVDFPKALHAGRNVTDPWYRCQALGCVVRYAPEGEVVRVAAEAMDAARLGRDVYRRVAVSSWPIGALVKRGKIREATRLIKQSLDEAARDPHPVSRMDALTAVWYAAWPLSHEIRSEALSALLRACREADSWKAGRTMCDVASIVASENRKPPPGLIAPPGASNTMISLRSMVQPYGGTCRYDADKDWFAISMPPLH